MNQTRSNPFDISGRTAVVTGGGRGLGLGVTKALLDAGCDVHVMARGQIGEDLLAYAEQAGQRVVAHPCDLADGDAIATVSAEILEQAEISILVNNAGTQERHPAVDFPMDSWDRVIGINLRAVWQTCQIFGREMVRREHGAIINFGSLLTFQGGITVPAYAAAKGGVGSLTKALCNEWSSKNVNVNCIAPGYMATDMNEALIADPERSAQISVQIPAGRWGTPQDVGHVCVFLASPAAAYIHGQVIAVDGGWMAR